MLHRSPQTLIPLLLLCTACGGQSALEEAETELTRYGPDLRVATISAPASARIGDPFVASAIVCNFGFLPATSSTLELRLSLDAVVDAGDPLVGSARVGALGRGSCAQASLSATAPARPGTWRLAATIDPANVIPEIQEQNNTLIRGGLATGAPDLVVRSVSIRGPFGLEVRVCNDGAFDTSSVVSVNAVTSTDGLIDASDPVFTAQSSNDRLAAHTCHTLELWGPIPAGLVRLGALVDPEQREVEQDETNNASAALDRLGSCSAGAEQCGLGQRCDFDPCWNGRCVRECLAGSSCDTSCPGGLCTLVCRAGATCSSSCDGGSCLLVCEAGSTCSSQCLGGSCIAACADGACDPSVDLEHQQIGDPGLAPVCDSGSASVRCNPGSACLQSCTSGHCQLDCTGSSACGQSCSGGGCDQVCGGTETCDQSCSGSILSPCTQEDNPSCAQGAEICPAGQRCDVAPCDGGRCKVDCLAGSTCDTSCPGGLCTLICRTGASCSSDCSGGSCMMICEPGSSCDLQCSGGSCVAACADGACHFDQTEALLVGPPGPSPVCGANLGAQACNPGSACLQTCSSGSCDLDCSGSSGCGQSCSGGGCGEVCGGVEPCEQSCSGSIIAACD